MIKAIVSASLLLGILFVACTVTSDADKTPDTKPPCVLTDTQAAAVNASWLECTGKMAESWATNELDWKDWSRHCMTMARKVYCP